MSLFFLYFMLLFIFILLYFFYSILLILLSLEFFMLFLFFFAFFLSLSNCVGYMILMLIGCFFVVEAVLGLVFFLINFRFFGSSFCFLW